MSKIIGVTVGTPLNPNKFGGSGLPPLKFTVEKVDGRYTSSKTFQELTDALDDGRVLICVLDGFRELPFTYRYGDIGLYFQDSVAGAEVSVGIVSRSSDDDRVNVVTDRHNIQIGDQTWGGEDGELDVDFTDTINGMIDDKVSSITPVPASDNLGVINVRDSKYGAKGDGVTDDTAAIQAALYEAEASGKPLYFPAGTYKVSKTITTHTRVLNESTGTYEVTPEQTSALNMYGAGLNTRFVTTEDFEGDYVFHIDIAAGGTRSLWVHDFGIDLVADVSGIYFNEIGMKGVVENLWFAYKYDKDPSDPNVRAAIYCRSATVVTFQRIAVFGNQKRITAGLENCGIVCAKSYSTKFIDCDIMFCKWAIYLSGGSNNLIENCRIDENEYGVYQNSTAPSINYMPETRAYPADSADSDLPTMKGTFRNLTIRKNRFECNNQYAIFLAAYSYGGSKSKGYMHNAQITIADNDFSGLGLWPKAMHTNNREVFRKAIHLYISKGIVIEGNSFCGKPYDESDARSKLQNVSFGRKPNAGPIEVYDVSIRDNVAPTGPLWIDSDTFEVIKTNTVLDDNVLEATGFVNDIEANQSTRESSSIEIDDALDPNSTNPVQNGVLTTAFNEALAEVNSAIGDIDAALDELHTYAQSLVNGGGAE